MPRFLPHLIAAMTAMTVVCIAVLDEPFARWLATRETYPDFWNTAIEQFDWIVFEEPYRWLVVGGLAGGSIALLVAARPRPPALYPLLLVTFANLLVRNITFWMKWGTGRLRPSEWLAKGNHDVWWTAKGGAFPSGHVVMFASLVIPLVILYPRLRLLLVVPAFSMVARVAVNAHSLSDVFGALALTLAVTWLLLRVLPASLRP